MISMFTEYPYLMVTYADHSIRTVADLVNLARSAPTPLLYGTPGNGSGPHLAIELLAKEAKIRLQHVPYRGSAPAAIDLIGKRLDFMMDPPAALLEFVRDGKLRAVAVTGDRRFFAVPETSDRGRSRCSRISRHALGRDSWRPPGFPPRS